MIIDIYQVDAFTTTILKGNPAAVCLLNDWLSDQLMQNIANENNLAETVFITQKNNQYHLRWFTPTTEVDLCGHATLAAAHVLFKELNLNLPEVQFETRSGVLKVKQTELGYELNLPLDYYRELERYDDIVRAFGIIPTAVYRGREDVMVVVENQQQVQNVTPNINAVEEINARGVIITAPGIDCDFVSRFFAPQTGIIEDHVTGSAHTTLAPYWSKQLTKNELYAKQLSKRGGELYCTIQNNRLLLSGSAVTYMHGKINLAETV